MAVYNPAEDSYLLLEAVKEHAVGDVLEVGTGTGILAIAAAKKEGVKSATATDISDAALHAARTNAASEGIRIKFRRADLFEGIRGQFDTIIFNPPYLPQDKGIEDRAIYGGRKGYETVERFIRASSNFLKPDGRIILVASSLTTNHAVERIIKDNCYDFSVIGQKRFFFETLYCYLIAKKPLLVELEKKGASAVRLFARGKRGVVYTAVYRKRKVAVKAERPDSKAKGRVSNEAAWLRRLNRKGIGPELVFAGNGFFAYRFVEGQYICDFLQACSAEAAVKVVKEVLRQCLLMDRMGVGKEEMHHPLKHIIVIKSGKPVMIDFERCHITVKPKNTTQFLQFLSSGRVSGLLKKKGIHAEPEKLRELARDYRNGKRFYA
ncbi:methyltransferase [Candidatus Woesearchaeota archaeon]|nr:methyltransferase [Candidatus Woesearchaeota archaeon]